ncbi:septal ring lytic transglycosylase RlpA family protein [Aeromonas sanarellii]|uniref:septal ring lytic transglycosylase RlpA family protein n=1 Tax=Aeromonas sanarellii TaxID=633415 RepID=UPI003BA14FF0
MKSALLLSFCLLQALYSCPLQAGKGEGDTQIGLASYYADRHHNKKTASGEPYKHHANTAAHMTLPFGSRVKVTNMANGKSIVVRINDRGRFSKGRVIDLSKAAFKTISNPRAGIIKVKLNVIQ